MTHYTTTIETETDDEQPNDHAEEATQSSNGELGLYDDMVKELKQLSRNSSYAKDVESGILGEARGREPWRLHVTLMALGEVDAHVHDHAVRTSSKFDELQQRLDRHVAGLESAVRTASTEAKTRFETTWDRVEASRETTLDLARENHEASLAAVREARDAVVQLHQEVDQRLSVFQETTASNFDNVNEHTRTEIAAVRDELSMLIDRRLNRVDQTFATVRADLDVMKALVMELIKERVGRPDVRTDR